MSTKGTITIPGQNITLQKDQSVALARLRKTIAALPHTRDDKPITPRMVVYTPRKGEPYTVSPFHEWENPETDLINPSEYKWESVPVAYGEMERDTGYVDIIDATHCFADPDKARAAKWSDK